MPGEFVVVEVSGTHVLEHPADAEQRLDSGTLSPLIKRLETAGYVRRERGTQDERSVTVHPTETGAALRDKALSVPHRILAATGLTSSEIVELQNLLDRATASLDGFNPLEDGAAE